MTDFLGAGVNLHFLGPDFSVSPVPYFQPSLSMGWAVHPLTVLTAELPGLLSLLLWVLTALRRKSLKAIVLFLFPLHVFFQVFVLEKSLNFTGKLDLVMSGLASAALP